jgi:hypothetical protein
MAKLELIEPIFELFLTVGEYAGRVLSTKTHVSHITLHSSREQTGARPDRKTTAIHSSTMNRAIPDQFEDAIA